MHYNAAVALAQLQMLEQAYHVEMIGIAHLVEGYASTLPLPGCMVGLASVSKMNPVPEIELFLSKDRLFMDKLNCIPFLSFCTKFQ